TPTAAASAPWSRRSSPAPSSGPGASSADSRSDAMTRPADDQAAGGRISTTRRMFLRGAGVTMALPWLESVPSWGAAAAGDVAPSPRRFAALFMGCGVHQGQWWARGSGADMELGRCLTPLEPLRPKITVIDGLFNRNATGVGIHPGQTGNILSGAAL